MASKEHGAQIRQLEEELARAQEIAAKAEKEGSRSRSHNSEDAAVILAELKVPPSPTAAGFSHRRH